MTLEVLLFKDDDLEGTGDEQPAQRALGLQVSAPLSQNRHSA